MKRRLFLASILALLTNAALAQVHQCQPLKHAKLPAIKGQTYRTARKMLLSAGWQSQQTIFPPVREEDQGVFYGNGEYFWKKGYVELESCSGTGLAWCSFLFHDAYGNRLRVSTSGEEGGEGENFHAKVRTVDFVCKKQQ
ncbi:MAG TPA: hypothetical protein VFR24_09290 [Candidatus Angelobacter sp.]|nr:hypothetical protein [Candidatus Angelobacter sp.]